MTYKDDCLIKKDIDRTYNFLRKVEGYENILLEASVLLQMFNLYRPDITYIQGMNYLMVMMLLHFEPY